MSSEATQLRIRSTLHGCGQKMARWDAFGLWSQQNSDEFRLPMLGQALEVISQNMSHPGWLNPGSCKRGRGPWSVPKNWL